MPNYDKPYKTYPEMLAILRSRNIIITNEEYAIEALSSLSYYDLINGNKQIFCADPKNDEFFAETTFESLYYAYTAQ